MATMTRQFSPQGIPGNDVTHVFAGEGSTPASLKRFIRRMEGDEFDLIAVGRVLLRPKTGALP